MYVLGSQTTFGALQGGLCKTAVVVRSVNVCEDFPLKVPCVFCRSTYFLEYMYIIAAVHTHTVGVNIVEHACWTFRCNKDIQLLSFRHIILERAVPIAESSFYL